MTTLDPEPSTSHPSTSHLSTGPTIDEPTGPWLTAEQQVIWRAFLGATTVLFDRLDHDVRVAHGLSMAEYEILVRLSEAPDHTIRMADLAGSVSHSRSRITHTVSRLQAAGLVSRIRCASDGRGVNAHLTDHGYSVLRMAAHTHVQGVRTYLVENATDEEFAAIGRVMERIVDQLGGPKF